MKGEKSTKMVNDSPFEIGGNYLIRTVTMIVTGRIESVGRYEIALSTAAWIADTGRYSDAIRTGEFREVEPYPADELVIVGRGALVDAVRIPRLPKEQR